MTKHYRGKHIWHPAGWILVALSASGLALLLIALLKQEVERGTRPTAHYGFFGCSGLPEPWEFREWLQYAWSGAVYRRSAECTSKRIGGEEDK